MENNTMNKEVEPNLKEMEQVAGGGWKHVIEKGIEIIKDLFD